MNLRDPKTQRIVLTGIFVVGLLVVYFGMNLLPFGYQARAAEIKELKEEYAQLSSKVNQAKRLAADLPRVEARHAATQAKWAKANELLPKDTAMADFLRKMTLVGQTSGVEFVKVEPDDPTSFQYYAENPVEFTVIGGYHQVGTFFGQISRLSRLVNVRMMNLVTLEGGEEDETVKATFVAAAYSVSGSHVRAKHGSPRPGVGTSADGDAKAGDTPAKPNRKRRSGHGKSEE